MASDDEVDENYAGKFVKCNFLFCRILYTNVGRARRTRAFRTMAAMSTFLSQSTIMIFLILLTHYYNTDSIIIDVRESWNRWTLISEWKR